MPFISIIIPTHNNEEHIEQAILSCFDSDFDDLEVIIVDDASTDKTLLISKELQTQYNINIKLIRLTQQKGPGEARNTGLKAATGEYIMFLDGDDWYEPKALITIKEALEKNQPDILMFNHQRAWDDGSRQPNIPNKYVELDTREKNLSDHNIRIHSIQNIHSACNKCYKKKLIEQTNISFTSGYYEDLPWSIMLCISAPSLYYIGEIIFNYRQRKGSITQSKSNKHLAIFQQFDLIFHELTQTRNGNLYKKYIFNYAKNQIFGLYRTNKRLHDRDKKIFIEKTRYYLRKWKPADI